MMMGADYYQTESEIASLLAEGKVPIGVGQNTKIRYFHCSLFWLMKINSHQQLHKGYNICYICST